jgi:hypothetical protein
MEEAAIAVILALGKRCRKSERTGVAMTKSPSQFGIRTIMFAGSWENLIVRIFFIYPLYCFQSSLLEPGVTS